MRTSLALIAAALMVAACSGGGQPGHTFEIVEEDGVPVAVSSAIPRFEGELFTYEKILELRTDPDNDDALLYQPRSFTLGDDGLYYVADNGNHRVAVFDSEGNFVRAFGRQGEGPGEFVDPVSVDVLDGVVTVHGRRTSRFRLDGTFIDFLTAEGFQPWDIVAKVDDRLIVGDMPQGPEDDGFYYASALVQVLDSSGEVVASVETPPVPLMKMLQGGPNRAALNYAGVPQLVYLPSEEILLTTGVEPVVSWYGLDGKLTRQVRIDLPTEAVTDEDRAVVEDRFDRLIENGMAHGADESYRDLVLSEKSKVEYAETKAHWRRIVAEDDGWLWLRFPTPDIGIYYRGTPRITQQQTFRIVDPEGELVGVTDWPPEVDLFGADIVRGHLLAMVPDPQTSETVPTVYRISSRVEGLVYQ